jgi:FkbM family methyltransferase
LENNISNFNFYHFLIYRLDKNKNNIKHYKHYKFKAILSSTVIIFTFVIGFYFGQSNHNKINKNEESYFSKNLSNFISYSQYLEDLILLSVFYDVKNGFYIDIGANDPNTISVTKNLYIRGWYGINIEPLEDKYQALVKYRNRDINLQIGVGKRKENKTLYIKGVGSTLQKNKEKGIKLIKINVDTMFNICRKYVPKNEIIHVCKIDVEGGEKDVLLGYDFKNYRPKVFCIEATKPNTLIPTHDQWKYILKNNNYSFVYQYSVNRFYIDDKIEGLRERFYNIEIIIKFYKNLNS